MQSRYVSAFLGCLAVFFTCKVLLAASCLVDPDPQAQGPTSIKPDGKTLERLSTSKAFSDCSRIVLVNGTIHVLYETPDGLKRQTCTEAGKPCPVSAGNWPSWLANIHPWGGVGTRQMDKTVSRLPGIPYGRVLSLERAATFNLAKAGLTQWHLTLLDAGSNKPIYRQAGSTPMLQIPRNLLRPGGKYTVLIDGGPQKYKGGFNLLGGAEAADIAQQIQQATTNAGATARAKKLDELIICYENNLDYEVELLREELKL